MITRVIVSANEDPTYISFWPAIAFAYKRMFKNSVEVHLAFLTNKAEDDPYVQQLRTHGPVTLFRPVPGVSHFCQAKMIRFILASTMENEVVYIDDIDLIPLSKSFITDKTDRRPAGNLLCVGGEVYNNNGCFPVSQMTGEGWLWRLLINPDNLPYDKLIDSWRGAHRVKYDRRENPDILLDWDKDDYFSDERLIRRLRSTNPVPIFQMKRGYTNFMEATVDRYDWKIDIDKLYRHGYVNAHGVRPYDAKLYAPLIDYITNIYPV